MKAGAISSTESIGHDPSKSRKSPAVKSSGLTKPEDTGREHYQDMRQTFTTEPSASKVFVNVAYD
ncbi:MAG: hypothetical protein ABI980_11085 [Nitrospirota bacterium]